MKRIRYAGGSFLTGDAIADALLDYATALARAGTADHVIVPGLGADEAPTSVDVVVGPASQLIAEHEESGAEEPHHEEFVADLRRRTRLATVGRVEQIGPPAGPDAAI